MGFTVGLKIDTGGKSPESIGESLRYTYNMGYAIRHGGISVYVLDDEDHEAGKIEAFRGLAYAQYLGLEAHVLFVLDGAPAADAIPALRACIERIERDRAQLVKDQPGNGWGTVDELLTDFLRPLLELCIENPKCTLWCC